MNEQEQNSSLQDICDEVDKTSRSPKSNNTTFHSLNVSM